MEEAGSTISLFFRSSFHQNYYSISKNLRNRFGSRCPNPYISRLSDYFILSSLESKETRIVEGANWKGELLSRADESDFTVFNFDSALKNFSFFPLLFSSKFSKKIVTCLSPPPSRSPEMRSKRESKFIQSFRLKIFIRSVQFSSCLLFLFIRTDKLIDREKKSVLENIVKHKISKRSLPPTLSKQILVYSRVRFTKTLIKFNLHDIIFFTIISTGG